MPKSIRLPAYCLHRPTGQAYVRVEGRFHYLGPHGSPESKARYRELTDALRLRQSPGDSVELSVGELILLYSEHARGYYVKHGEPTSEVGAITAALKILMAHRRRRAADIGPALLTAVRNQMVEEGLARTTINSQIGRIRRMIRWAVAEQFLRPEVLVAASALQPLREGRSTARETEKIRPVPDADVDATLPFLTPPLRAAVEVLRLTGARTGEILAMRTGEIDRTGEVWVYTPSSHKTEHRGKSRTILLGPKSQEIIAPLLRADANAYVFRPATPNNRSGVTGRRPPGERYHGQAIRKAVLRAVQKANEKREQEDLTPVDHWHPHQLRHSAATKFRKEFGVEVAQTALGHATADMTEQYAERDLAAARAMVLRVG